jgi:hypothetical protein
MQNSSANTHHPLPTLAAPSIWAIRIMRPNLTAGIEA